MTNTWATTLSLDITSLEYTWIWEDPLQKKNTQTKWRPRRTLKQHQRATHHPLTNPVTDLKNLTYNKMITTTFTCLLNTLNVNAA